MAKARGMATDALRRNLGKAIEAASNRGRGAWDRQIGAGFGQPGAQRRIRDFPVSEQERIVGHYQQRDAVKRKRSTTAALGAMFAEGVLDDAMPVALNVEPHTINPDRPRCQRGGYDSKSGTVRLQFRDGAVYEYYDVPKNVWRNLLRGPSTGRYINRVLDTYPYTRVSTATGEPMAIFSTHDEDYAGYDENPGGRFLPDEGIDWTGYTAPKPGSGWFRR